MTTRRRRRFTHAAVVLVCVVPASAACGGDAGESQTSAEAPRNLTGLIVDIKGTGESVSSFTLRSGGESYRIRIAAGVDYGFDPSHLRLHASTRWPVHCTVERRLGALYALAIEDA